MMVTWIRHRSKPLASLTLGKVYHANRPSGQRRIIWCVRLGKPEAVTIAQVRTAISYQPDKDSWI